jgi:hypothetical protein
MKEAGCSKTISVKMTGANFERKKLDEAILHRGQTIHLPEANHIHWLIQNSRSMLFSQRIWIAPVWKVAK